VTVAGSEYFLWNRGFLDLDGRVIDPEQLASDSIDSIEKIGAIEAVVCNDMTTHSKYSRSKCPHMKVMYGPYPANLSELLSQTDNIDMRRGTLQKDVDRVANDDP
jgi:hypothetical protein